MNKREYKKLTRVDELLLHYMWNELLNNDPNIQKYIREAEDELSAMLIDKFFGDKDKETKLTKNEYKRLVKIHSLLVDYLIIQEENDKYDYGMYINISEAESLLSVMLLHYTWHKEDKEKHNDLQNNSK